ncbi:hypothetical protein BJ170DRAFT_637217 [Xylariales sp. AK1849]|nr:hypothetical protein BJ170DRAFT_637217 [Xylariales sp. AK1849]
MFLAASQRRRLWLALALLFPLFWLYRLQDGSRIGGTRWSRHGPPDTQNNTLGFTKIFVINRPSRTDRRDAMALAGAVSNLSFDWVDGVDGSAIQDDVLPPGHSAASRQSAAARGSWRAHVNALQMVIDQDLSSALIMEDDVDWDIRLKDQVTIFSLASRAWLERIGSSSTAAIGDESSLMDWMTWSGMKPRSVKESEKETADRISVPLQQNTVPFPSTNPYGDGWDVLWLGHCGTDFPKPNLPQLRVTVPNDPTVPAPKYLKPHPFALNDPIGEEYPPHTRVVHAASGTVCTLAYAVSQQGARKLLLQFGLESFTKQWDLMLGDWCDGAYAKIDKSGAGSSSEAALGKGGDSTQWPVCLAVQPPLVSHHYAKGGSSDIKGQGGGYIKTAGTLYIRHSVRMNIDKLVTGRLDELTDQWQDDGS